MVVWEPSGAVGNLPPPLPEKFTSYDEPVDMKNTKTSAVLEVSPRNADGEPSHEERSLHPSDLFPGTLGTDVSFPTANDREEGKKNVFTSEQDGLGFMGESNRAVELDEEDIEPQQPTKIQVMLPSVDNSVHEESSAHVSVDQDTFGDVSSMSGGDF